MGWFGKSNEVEEEDKIEVDVTSKSGNVIILKYDIYAGLKPKLVELIDEYNDKGFEVKGWLTYTPDSDTANILLVKKK